MQASSVLTEPVVAALPGLRVGQRDERLRVAFPLAIRGDWGLGLVGDDLNFGMAQLRNALRGVTPRCFAFQVALPTVGRSRKSL